MKTLQLKDLHNRPIYLATHETDLYVNTLDINQFDAGEVYVKIDDEFQKIDFYIIKVAIEYLFKEEGVKAMLMKQYLEEAIDYEGAYDDEQDDRHRFIELVSKYYHGHPSKQKTISMFIEDMAEYCYETFCQNTFEPRITCSCEECQQERYELHHEGKY